METMIKIKDLIEKMSVETQKVHQRGNRSAAVRARKYAQQIKSLVSSYRKEIMQEIRKHHATRD